MSSKDVGPPPARRLRRRRVHLGIALAVALAGAVLFYGVRTTPWLGPIIADGLRSVVGQEAVTTLEEIAAEVEDRWRRIGGSRDAPRRLEDVSGTEGSASPPSAIPPVRERSESDVLGPPPADVGPMERRVAAVGDGVWVPVCDPVRPAAPPLLHKALVHPDSGRPWAELFVVAVRRSSVRVRAVAGTREPVATTAEGKRYERRGLVPEADRGALLAAFNGGFKTQHGQHGMMVDGVVLVPPKPSLCTLAGYADGSLRIATWSRLGELPAGSSVPAPEWYRQTPGCMVEQGELHAGLRNPDATSWGATLEGDTVIRRSAIGSSRDGGYLYVAVSNYTTARALALGMQHVGAFDVAQLDVNWSYPKFLLFPLGPDGRRHSATLFKGFLFEEDEYLWQPSKRDFFYLVRAHE